MELILWRHADAESGIPDEERKLSAKGLKQAARMADWLKARLPKEAVILVSPARRAQETARALAKKFEVRTELGTMATPRSILDTAGWPGGEGVVVVVGHQPTLGQAIALALMGSAAEWSVRKGAIWWLERRDRDAETLVRAVISPDLL
jgi:phosphohistidine phosphatase